ncbi:MAG: trypsin-like peptidase domain-containing protein [Aggregatilineales bacterium]
MTNILQAFSDEMATIASTTQRALVQITDGQNSIGSGTIWHSDGLIITNAHVIVERAMMRRGRFGSVPVNRQREVHVVLGDGQSMPVKVLAIDEENDLAALSVDATNLPTINIGDSKQVKSGQWVMAMGHPWGVIDSITAGVVIGVGADLPEIATGREWIALNLQLRPGHSGGPLVDIDGNLIGVNTMITGPEVGFAIPSHTVKRFLKDKLGDNVADSLQAKPPITV